MVYERKYCLYRLKFLGLYTYSFPGFIFVGNLCTGAHVHMIVHIISVNERFCPRGGGEGGGGEVACDADSVY